MLAMIVTDLDGTLLRNEGYISDYTLSVLGACRAKGIKIAFATARSSRAARRFLEQFMPDVFIGYGGALIMAGDTVLDRRAIPADISFGLIGDCLRTPEVSAIFAINESVALSNHPRDGGAADTSHYRHYDFSQNDGFSYLKISVTASDPRAVERVAAHYPMCDMLRYTGEDLYRFAHSEAIKWNAVKTVAKHFNLDTGGFVAFGDDVNDLEMIERCGIGVAMGNAVDSVKAAADDVCASNEEDGVARWLQGHVL